MGWSENDPDSLQDICLEYLTQNLNIICDIDPQNNVHTLKEGIILPLELCEGLLKTFCKNSHNKKHLNGFLGIFSDLSRTQLKHLNVRETLISDSELTDVLGHELVDLDISYCTNLTSYIIECGINRHGKSLQRLNLGQWPRILEDYLDMKIKMRKTSCGTSKLWNSTQNHHPDQTNISEDPILDCPDLRSLTLHRSLPGKLDILSLMLQYFTKLCHLDLSSSCIPVDDMDFLVEMKSLVSLILFDVKIEDFNKAFGNIAKLNKLRHLDISQVDDSSEPSPVFYPENIEVDGVMMPPLQYLVPNLPHLRSLDISGTNLAGFERPPSISHSPGKNAPGTRIQPKSCPIPGLEGRTLDFLGLFNCAHDACRRENLPAAKVTGDDDETQVILAIHVYQEKGEVLLKALNNIYQLFRIGVITKQREALLAILDSMDRHPEDRAIQISGSASLFYIIRGEEKMSLNHKNKRRIIATVLDGMENHIEETTMLRNGCLTLCNFNIPHDVLFAYERVVKLLLQIVKYQEDFVQRIGIYLLNSLACQVDGTEKKLVGDLGAVQVMLDIVKDRLTRGVCDEVMEIAWSTMWNVTDETASNCEKFIAEHPVQNGSGDQIVSEGMQLFLGCLQTFPDRHGLLRNMMGLMGNVAEVDYLRPSLMKSKYVSVFRELLAHDSDGIEVSYNAAGVLAHMASDGVRAWTINQPDREDVLAAMVEAISNWQLDTKRNINYRSFEPILRLLPCYDTPQVQHWATWALANLTSVYPDKYCKLVIREQGIPLLEHILSDPRPYKEIKQLCRMVVGEVDLHRKRKLARFGDVDHSEDEMEQGDEMVG